MATKEHARLEEARTGTAAWKKWGPYLSERQWGTVREDYSETGDAWNFFTHDHARSRAYRWGEDGIAGISDDKQRLCFSLALWNGKDPILKERLFGLTNSQGNHGEDVKEYYFYLDSTPTHSYMKYLYKYPQAAYPYGDLVRTNSQRSRYDMEYELLDTGVFNDNRYFDVFVEYAKGAADDILVKISATNRGPDAADLHLLPTLWFRNDWSRWIAASNRAAEKPHLEQIEGPAGTSAVAASHPLLGSFVLSCDGDVPLLFTENETNHERLFPGQKNESAHVKDGINDFVVNGRQHAVNPEKQGTKVAAHYQVNVGAGKTAVIRLRLSSSVREQKRQPFGKAFDTLFDERRREADEFYQAITPPSAEHGRGQRDAPGHCRHALEQAVLLLRRRQLAGRAQLQPAPFRLPADPELGVVPHAERGRHLDAGQVGVPVVRGLGPGLPRAPALDRRSRLRQEPDEADAARLLPAPDRPDARVRVELQRREPAGPRVRHALPPPHRAGPARRSGPRVPQGHVQQAGAELHLVGQPQGPLRQERVRGRLPRPRQHRRVRPERAAADRRASRTGGRHGLDGPLQPEHAGAGRGAGRARPHVRRHGVQVRRALLLHRRWA